MRTVSWFSCGAASAVATKLRIDWIDVIAYCETGSEDEDNHRFMLDCQEWFGKEITPIKSSKFNSTWEVWEKRRYISGIAGAPCTQELKIKPRLEFERPDDIHVFGYTADSNDVRRAVQLRENWPELSIETPLIDRGINKEACLAMIQNAGIEPPRTYAMGFPNANCIPCCKATSPDYYQLIRREYPDEWKRFNDLCHELNCRPARIKGVRVFIDEIPEDHPCTAPLAPACDFLCQIAEQDMTNR